MHALYGRWMLNWEDRLCSRATNRVVRPFEWGLEWTHTWPCAQRYPQNGHDPHAYLKGLNQAALETSDEFFGYRPPSDFKLSGDLLEFTSPVRTPYTVNDHVRG